MRTSITAPLFFFPDIIGTLARPILYIGLLYLIQDDEIKYSGLGAGGPINNMSAMFCMT